MLHQLVAQAGLKQRKQVLLCEGVWVQEAMLCVAVGLQEAKKAIKESTPPLPESPVPSEMASAQ